MTTKKLVLDVTTRRELIEAIGRLLGPHSKKILFQLRPGEIVVIAHAEDEFVLPDGALTLEWVDGRFQAI